MQKFLKIRAALLIPLPIIFKLISIIYCIFSNKQPKHLFQSWPSTRAAYSGAHLIEGVPYSVIEKNNN